MKSSLNPFFLLLFAVFFISSCDEGLQPENKADKAIIRWKINYVGGVDAWKDSVYKQIRAIAFKNIPNENTNLVKEILEGKAIFTNDSLPMNVSETIYDMEIVDLPVELKYLAVVKQFGDNFLADWRVIGLFASDAERKKPKSVIITKGNTYVIEINVDLNNLPPQPFNQ